MNELNITPMDNELTESVTEEPGLQENPATGKHLWESDWFSAKASGSYDFEHDLNIVEPWKCLPMLVARVTNAVAGYAVGDIVFGDGANYNGATSGSELGWLISISENSAHLAFGNGAVFVYSKKGGGLGGIALGNAEFKLLMYYPAA